jgi:2-amino-4-hydroxy-6-hydroxymethyldihydropteridine diphosphokinase
LLLGSNQGNSHELLRKAISLLELRIGKIETASSVYSTKAWGKTDQPDFLNQVVIIPYTGTAIQALEIVLSIEHEMGRVRSKKWGSRIIDIDLLYFDDQIHHTSKLTLPHPVLHLRRFTLVPLVEILPDFIHPVINKTQQQLLDTCADKLEVLKLV